MSDSMLSFVNGVIAGAGAALAIMSVAFVYMVAPLEGVMGFTSTDMRVAILLGGIVCAVAVGYEFYRKKETKDSKDQKEDIEKDKTQQTDQENQKDVNLDE